jgi:SAM-dependent methyltransferase
MFDSYEQIFARRADRYRNAMAMCPQARDAEFLAVVAPLGDMAATVFDVPAGGGWLRRYLREGTRYVAVEPAESFFVECPEDRLAERIRSPIEAVPRPGGCADAIVSLAGLHHVADPGPAFGEMHRLLGDGGLLVIADVAAGTGPDRFLNGFVDANNPMGHEGRFLDAGTAAQLESAGFDLLDDALIAMPWRFDHPEQGGAYCADLFGIEGCSLVELTTALTDLVGAGQSASSFTVEWCLRRIVCRKR